MRKSILAICSVALLGTGAAHASDPSKEEKVGVGTGAVIGGIAAGPVGFMIGAAIGAKVGDTIHQKNESIDSLNASLQRSKVDMRRLNANYAATKVELEKIQEVARPELVSMLQAGIAMDLLFRTDESVLADTTGDRLATLGRTLAAVDDIQVQLDGFAHDRADEISNYELSQKSVELVRAQLIAVGIDPARIRVSAHGEAPAQDASADSYALERRVSLTLFIDNPESVAQLP